MVANSQNTGAVLPTVPISTQKKRNNFAARRAYFPWLLIAPTLIIISAVIIYPMVYSVYVSFTPFNLLRPETFAFDPDRIFRNYERLWEDELFWQSLGNTVLFLAVTVNLEYVLALGLSQLIARVTFGQGLIRTLLMIPMMFAPVLVGFQFAWFFNATVGLVNNALMGFGLMTEPKAWLVDVPTGMMTIMLATIWMNVPITTVILLAGTLSLPTEIYEAAEVDGAGWWVTFRRITLPLLQPFILIALTVRSLDVGRAYDIVRIMTDGGPANRTEMIWTYTGEMAIQNSRFGLASAMSMVSVILGVVFTLYLFRQLIKSRVVQ
jgi:multiple sugar transport system permease protein